MGTIIDTDTLSEAAVMLDALRDELVKAGLTEELKAIRGIELFSYGGAHAALETLKSMRISGDADDVRKYTIAALERGCEAYAMAV